MKRVLIRFIVRIPLLPSPRRKTSSNSTNRRSLGIRIMLFRILALLNKTRRYSKRKTSSHPIK
jgi:hypothetical protein